jgi:nucleotide-binding universal stress UspA family protein
MTDIGTSVPFAALNNTAAFGGRGDLSYRGTAEFDPFEHQTHGVAALDPCDGSIAYARGTIDCPLKEGKRMTFKDILLTLTSYPEPTPVSVIDDAVSIAATFGAHLAAVCCEVHIQVPGHFLAGSIANIPGIIAGEAEKSRNSAKDMLAAFDAAAEKAGVLHETFVEKCPTFQVPDLLVDYARLRDLTIVPVPESYDQWYAEAVMFGSGRPIIILPVTPRLRRFELGTVAVAWDFSRAAARAVSDALPLLEKAKKVRVVTVINEKTLDTRHSAEELSKNLSRHGIDVVLDRVNANGRPIGAVLETYVASHEVDVLVMGAYGHSRLREFVLGGATKSLLSKPPLPVLFSH